EFYVSFGGDRDWEEARQYGFSSAGGGAWYAKTLGLLEPGSRFWVNMPGTGYVGVGRVVEKAVPIDDFRVAGADGKQVPITSLPLKVAKSTTRAQDAERAEYVVRVEWIKTVPVTEAVREKGRFGNQNTVAKPRTEKWAHTVERLKSRFGILGAECAVTRQRSRAVAAAGPPPPCPGASAPPSPPNGAPSPTTSRTPDARPALPPRRRGSGGHR